MTGDTFRQRHAERAIQRGGNLVAIVRIDDQGAGQLLRRPGKLRQDQYAGLSGSCAATYSFATVHTIA